MEKRNKRLNKKAQLTIFIILGILIVIMIILLVLNWNKLTFTVSAEPPIEKLKNCVGKDLDITKEKIAIQGGSFNPQHFYLYDGNKVEYLCYTSEYYKNCIMQKPFLKQSIQEALEEDLEPKLRTCLSEFREEMLSQGYEISMQNPQLIVELLPGTISAEIKANLKITKEDTQIYESIKTKQSSQLYEMIMVASSILNWEARYGDAEITAYMTYYPDLKVEKKVQGEGTAIYIITNKETGEVFQFASRSLVIPPGVIG